MRENITSSKDESKSFKVVCKKPPKTQVTEPILPGGYSPYTFTR